MLLILFVVAYVAVALANFSLVQSFAGSMASDYFSREWGGKVRVGSVGINPFNHLVLHNVELVSPQGDTIIDAGKMVARFNKFPVDDQGLTVSYVRLQDTYYHLAIDSNGLNLKYIIDYFKSDKEKAHSGRPFIVQVDEVVLDNVNYRQDLKEKGPSTADTVFPWVNIKHMEYRQIEARLRNVRVDGGDVTCRIDRFSTTEKCGLELRNLQGNIYVTKSGIGVTNLLLLTADSRLEGEVLMDYYDWKSMKHFMDSVYFNVSIKPGSYGSIRDAAYWAKTLWDMDERAFLSGHFCGPLSHFRADGFKVAFGKESRINFNASLEGLPQISTTQINADISRLHTTYADLAAVRHPNGITMKAQNILRSLDTIDLSASFSGTIFDFSSQFKMESKPGQVSGNVKMAFNTKANKFVYQGDITSGGFALNKIFPNEWVSRSGFELNFNGTGIQPQTMNAQLSGRLHHTVLRNKRLYAETAIDAQAADGHITAEVSLDDALAKFLIEGDVTWREDKPVYKAKFDVDYLDLKRLGMWSDTNDHEVVFAAHGDGRYLSLGEGNTIGRVTFSDVALYSTTRRARLETVSLLLTEKNHWKDARASSELFDARLRGYLNWEGVPVLVNKFMADYMPEMITEKKGEKATTVGSGSKKSHLNTQLISDARFDIDLHWTDSTDVLEQFIPELTLARGTSLQVNYSFAESFKPVLRSDSIGWGSLMVYNVGMSGEAIADNYTLQLKCDEVKLGNLLFSENADVFVETSKQNINTRVWWENESPAIGDGSIAARIVCDSGRMSLVLQPSEIELAGEVWTLNEVGEAVITPSGWWIDGLRFRNGEKRLDFSASRRGEKEDNMSMTLRDFNLSVVNSFLQTANMSASGVADGDVVLSGFDATPYLDADVNITGLVLNDEPLGDATIHSSWNADLNRLDLHVNNNTTESTNLQFALDGYASLGKDEIPLNFKASLGEVGLRVIEPFVSSFSSDVDGRVSADLDIHGTLKAPLVEGDVVLDSVSLLVEFLNVRYTTSDTIRLDEDAIIIDNMELHDPQGGSATISGVVNHNYFKDVSINLNASSDHLLCMNTTARQSPLYYGTIVAAVDGSVRGPISDIDILLDARTLEGSTLNIPINDRRELQQANYIYFVDDHLDPSSIIHHPSSIIHHPSLSALGDNPEPFIQNTEYRTQNTANRYHLVINVDATPDMLMHLPMDFSSIGADVKAWGGGDLQLSVGTGSPFSIVGVYEMFGGSLLLDALGVLSKEFSIEENSSINFPGSISDAIFDIRAVLSQKVNVSTLTGSMGSSDAQRPVTVENVIALSGSLQSPGINFDIRLPDADQSVQEEVFAYIDRSNERDMLTQTVSLLLTKKFYNSSSSAADMGTAVAAEGSYGFVAGALAGIVGDMIPFLNVNFDYQAGNALTTDQIAVDISKEWNKLYFETTLGFGGEAREMAGNAGNNNMTGDMLVGYKFNTRFHLFVFNRSNTNDYSRANLPYKQGVGLKYTRDFDNFKDLFKKK